MTNLVYETTQFQSAALGAAGGVEGRGNSILQSQIINPKHNVKKRLNEISMLPIAINEME